MSSMSVARGSGWQTTAAQSGAALSRGASSSVGAWSSIILATSVTALAGLALHRWVSAPAGNVDENRDFAGTKKKVMHAYAYVLGGFALTGLSAVAAHVNGLSLTILRASTPLYLGLAFCSIGLGVATAAISKDQSGAKHAVWVLFNATMGLMLSPLCFVNKGLLAQAGAISLGIGGLCTLAATMAPDERFLKWEGPLMAALTGLSAAGFVAWFFPGSAFAYGVDRVGLYGGLLIFTGLFMASTQRLWKEAKEQPERQFDPIRSSLGIYLDGLNIALKILRILMENQKNQPQSASKRTEKP